MINISEPIKKCSKIVPRVGVSLCIDFAAYGFSLLIITNLGGSDLIQESSRKKGGN